jgi:hypothetical protein
MKSQCLLLFLDTSAGPPFSMGQLHPSLDFAETSLSDSKQPVASGGQDVSQMRSGEMCSSDVTRRAWHPPRFEELDVEATESMCSAMGDATPGSLSNSS